MHEVSVSAYRRLSDTGLQRTTLDTTILHQNVALSMSDILTQHSSLFIKSYGRATESTVEFRGTSPSHTQVLWNGMKINSPMLGTVDFSTIPAYFVDEANLLHGASSLTLTGGGLGGAVDLATRPVSEQGFGLQYIQGVGSFHTFDQFLRFTYGSERFTSSTRVCYATSDNDFRYTNYDKKVDERDADGHIIKSYHPTERNRSGYFHDLHVMQEFAFRPVFGGTLNASAWYTHSLRGLPFLSVDYRDDRDFTNEQGQDAVRSVVAWQRALGTQWRMNARLGYAYQSIAYDYSTTRSPIDDSPVEKTVITASHSYSQQADLEVKTDYMPAADWLLTATLGLTYDHVRSRDRSPFHIGDNYNEGRMESSLSLINMPDEALHEAYCVLKKGGRLIISDLYEKDPDEDQMRAVRIEADRQSRIPHKEGDCEERSLKFVDFRFEGAFYRDALIRQLAAGSATSATSCWSPSSRYYKGGNEDGRTDFLYSEKIHRRGL